MKINLAVDRQTNTYVEILKGDSRTPLGRRNQAQVATTVRRGHRQKGA